LRDGQPAERAGPNQFLGWVVSRALLVRPVPLAWDESLETDCDAGTGEYACVDEDYGWPE